MNQPQDGPTRTLRVAVIGAGRMAREHLNALRRVAVGHVVVGLCDVSELAARELSHEAGAPVYPSFSALLAEARPDIVHVCTPAGKHFDPAREALLAGAHVYVEKPFVETRLEAEALLRVADGQRRLVCAGHQLLWDPAFHTWIQRTASLAPVYLVDSHFTFRPPQLRLDRSGRAALAAQLVDILPHPLYTLIAALERFGGEPRINSLRASPTELEASLRAGEVTGRLLVSLRARPVASVLTAEGAGGSLSIDFIRSITLGAANPGTTPLEKIVNPFREGWQLQWRTGASLFRRLVVGGGYPGLAELLSEFYGAVTAGKASPIAPAHLARVTQLHEQLSSEIRRVASARPSTVGGARQPMPRPLAVVTGARGFLGREVVRHLADRGYQVRGVSRSSDLEDTNVHEWVTTDLCQDAPVAALSGAEVVIHAAAETAGGFNAHQRNSIDATANVLRAMRLAGVRRLVHVSSLSVLRPPSSVWERQNERTPLAPSPEALGAYTWGKCLSELSVAEAEKQGGVEARIVRPGALVDWDHPEVPGLLGRRLYGSWHLGLGRPSLPLATVEVGKAAAAIAWCAAHFDDAPPIVNLMDDAIGTRGELLALFRAHGWHGRMVWLPISLVAGLIMAARSATALVRLRRPNRLAAWAILRPRRYDPSLATEILRASAQTRRPVAQPRELQPVGS